MPQEPLDDEGVVEGSRDPAFAQAVRPEQHVHLDDAAPQVGPGGCTIDCGPGPSVAAV